MQAIILAGGYGTRLYPLTINAPKPMIEVWGKPMIEYLIKKIQNIPEITEIFIVSNNKFSHLFEAWVKEKEIKNVTIINDQTTSNEDRLWSIGDIQYVLDHANIHEDIMILWGDNFIEDDFKKLLQNFHQKGDTVGLYDVGDIEYVKQLGNPIFDDNWRITSFIEKPLHPTSSLISTLIYVLKNSSLKYILEVMQSGQADRAGDFVAYLCQKEPVYGHVIEGKWFDIGTLEQLKKAEEWIELKKREDYGSMYAWTTISSLLSTLLLFL